METKISSFFQAFAISTLHNSLLILDFKSLDPSFLLSKQITDFETYFEPKCHLYFVKKNFLYKIKEIAISANLQKHWAFFYNYIGIFI